MILIISTERLKCYFLLKALVDIVNKISQSVPSAKTDKKVYSSLSDVKKTGSEITTGAGGVVKTADEKPFDSMNNIVANLLLNMTRYEKFKPWVALFPIYLLKNY